MPTAGPSICARKETASMRITSRPIAWGTTVAFVDKMTCTPCHGCRGGPKGRQPTSGQGATAEGRTQAARATKYIEFHGGVRLPHVYLPAQSLHILRSVPREAGCREAGVSHGEEATAAGANSNTRNVCPVGRDWWGGERVVGGVLSRMSVGTWGLCARLCLVLVCRGRYGLGGGFFSSVWDRVWAE